MNTKLASINQCLSKHNNLAYGSRPGCWPWTSDNIRVARSICRFRHGRPHRLHRLFSARYFMQIVVVYWIKSLISRSNAGCLSSTSTVTCSVHQGCVLGPLLFLPSTYLSSLVVTALAHTHTLTIHNYIITRLLTYVSPAPRSRSRAPASWTEDGCAAIG